jgi:nitroreductase
MSLTQIITKLIHAMETRHSHRHFLNDPLSESDLQKIQLFLNEIMKSKTIPFEHNLEFTIHSVSPKESVVYFPGSQNFVAFKSSETIIDQAKVGFLGELLILYCESIGVNTCWMGHYKKRNVYQIVYNCEEKNAPRQIYCISPLGYSPEKRNLIDRMSTKFFSKKNKPLDKFLHPDSIQNIPDSIRYILQLASKAPSAMNTQNWYYLIQETSSEVIIELSKPAGYQHFKWHHYDIDVGCAAAHIWLGLKENYKNPKLTIEGPSGDAIWRFFMSK